MASQAQLHLLPLSCWSHSSQEGTGIIAAAWGKSRESSPPPPQGLTCPDLPEGIPWSWRWLVPPAIFLGTLHLLPDKAVI